MQYTLYSRASLDHIGKFLTGPASRLQSWRITAAERSAEFDAMAQASLAAQRDIERTQEGDFDTFVAAYRASTLGNIAI
ncbi:hypothetical protein [Herbaspirillum sp. B65]|uniref:hypothetical protein n=1 Tax=Herbaspirillum sp. B65 TaxID=137708 RepID=UPI0011D22FAD|nr:hypothetical protein [Herbaspirillum sp. B65]